MFIKVIIGTYLFYTKSMQKITHPKVFPIWKIFGCVPYGSPSWTRTNDPAVNSRMLYRLSY